MEEEIKKAITLLKKQWIFCKLKSQRTRADNAKECSGTGARGECTDCSCFAGIIGCDF